MQLNTYQEEALRFLSTSPGQDTLDLAVLGISGALGELTKVVGSWIIEGKSLERDQLVQVCGEMLWSTATLLTDVAVPFEEALECAKGVLPSPPSSALVSPKDGALGAVFQAMVATGLLSAHLKGWLSQGKELDWRVLTFQAGSLVLALDSLLFHGGSSRSEAMERNLLRLAGQFPEGCSKKGMPWD